MDLLIKLTKLYLNYIYFSDSQHLDTNEAIVVFRVMLKETQLLPIRYLGIFLFTITTTIMMILEKKIKNTMAKVNFII